MTTTYLITGANRGIGLEMSRQILESGDRLYAVCRNPETATELNKFVQESNGRGQIFKSDAYDEIALANIANAIVGGIDVLVCNAGVMSARGGLSDAENNVASVSEVLMTNTAGPFFAARAFHKNLKLSSAPRICIISSYMGSQQHQGASAYFYRASKAGANNIMVTLANELKSDGITVASFHPGWVKTEMGGSGADITPQVSASGLIQQFQGLKIANTGAFLNYDGKSLPL
jgi:NAD(P)-dependent dehydrogenase (short-subunit alcohol dehydrogenase family)